MLKGILEPIVKYKMKREDREIMIESIILIIIYFLSFLVLSLGRVQQTFMGLSESTFSSIQLLILTFIFAVIITFIVYSAYKKVIS